MGSDNHVVTSAVSSSLIALATLVVILRFYCRKRIAAAIASDDWWALAGIILTAGTGTLVLYGVRSDPDGGDIIDRDDPSFDYKPHATYLRIQFTAAVFYFSLVTTVNISILLLYRRIFAVDNPRSRFLLAGVAQLTWWVVGTIATLLSCFPVETLWVGPSVGECFNFNVYWMAMGVAEVMIDTAILLLPVGVLLDIQLSRKQKIALFFIFLLGSFVIISGIIRIIFGYEPGSRSVNWPRAALWSAAHVAVANICASLPTLRPLCSLSIWNRIAEASSSFWRTRNQRPHKQSSNEPFGGWDMKGRPQYVTQIKGGDGPAVECRSWS